MYFRNARLDQRPISMIEKTGTPARYMAIAAPDRIKCVPTSDRWMPSFVSPMATTPSLSRFATISDVMLIVLFLCRARETGESLLVPLNVWIRLTIEAHSLTGHMIGLSVFHCVTVSDFLSFFCLSKVIETQSARFNLADVWLRIFPPLMKTMFRRQSCFVCCFSALETLEYSHDRIAQKCAAAASSPIARRNSVAGEKRMRR